MDKAKDVSLRRSQLSAAKQALLEKRLRGERVVEDKQRHIPKRPMRSAAPLSFAQQRLWVLDQLSPGIAAYNMPGGIYISGRLDVTALARSFQEIVRRHEALRTTFRAEEGKPVQRIQPTPPPNMALFDLRGLSKDDQACEVRRLSREESESPFDLTKGPLIRTNLLWLDEEEYVLVWTTHHIASDGWSGGVITRELASLYEVFRSGKASLLPELPIQYADFAVWQREWLQGEVLESQLSYWSRQLEGATPLRLPTDHPRPEIQSYRGAWRPFTFSGRLVEELKALCKREGVTLFMVLLAAYQVLIHRYTGQDDIVLGSPIANRNRVELEDLIGFFVNTLVMRTDLSGDPSFRELLKRVREVALGAFGHQDLPFEKLVEELKPERRVNQNPVFQVVFAVQNETRKPLTLPGLTIRPLELEATTTRFDLEVHLGESGGVVVYSTDLFESETIDRMVDHYRNLLEGVVADPERRVSELPLLTEAERTQVLSSWNETEQSYAASCIHELVEAQVEKTPEAVALTMGVESLSYLELNRRANQLAHHLRGVGVGPEVPVGICAERSIESVVAALGIVKAGGAYVPLDPAYPGERLATMWEDAGVRVILAQKRWMEVVAGEALYVIAIDEDWGRFSTESVENPVHVATPDNAAYVIFTSGSTGRPKGVIVTHRGLVNLVSWHSLAHEVSHRDRATQVAAPGFDASVWEIWPYLSRGAGIHIPSEETRSSISELSGWLVSQGITLSFLPTPLAEAFLEEPMPGGLCLRGLLTGGDKLHRAPRPGTPFTLSNHYGPTENTVVTTWCVVPEENSSGRVPPIGRPISNVRVYVLDGQMTPVPVGVVGELYIGGEGLARGYLNRSDLTAESFVPDPFSGEPGARLYRSGDHVRYLADGNIEYQGRRDHQVKIRGFRIELREIEALLRLHPKIHEAVVITRKDGGGRDRLVAYVVGRPQRSLDTAELGPYLREKLPEYMVPSFFVRVETIPKTANGKVDRDALPEPDSHAFEVEVSYVAPRTPVERKLAEIWAETIGVEKVGVHDNFFELGGDSILSIQILSRAQRAGIELEPKQMFLHQTIAELAGVVTTSRAVEAEQGPVHGSVPLTPIQHWFFEQELADPAHFNQSVLLKAADGVDPIRIEKVFSRLWAHHDVLRLRFTREGSDWAQFHAAPDRSGCWSRVDLSVLDETEQSEIMEGLAADLQGSLNLSDGPMGRVIWLDLGRSRQARLLVIIHHLAVDGVSWWILLDDLQTAYRDLIRGEAIQLPRKTTSFKSWAEALVRLAQSDEMGEEIDTWLSLPAGQVSGLPMDREVDGTANVEGSARTISVSLSAEETRALLQEVPHRSGVQVLDVLLTALVQCFSHWAGSPRLLVDLEGHGRGETIPEVDLARTLGWFTSIYPLLLDLERAGSTEDALKSVMQALRKIPNKGIGYGLLRYLRAGRIKEKLQLLPQAEVSFNYLGRIGQSGKGPHLFTAAPETLRRIRSLKARRRYLLGIDALVAQDRLRVDWSYCELMYRSDTMEALAGSFVEAVRSVVAHCLSAEHSSQATPDFPRAQLDPMSLENVFGQAEFE